MPVGAVTIVVLPELKFSIASFWYLSIANFLFEFSKERSCLISSCFGNVIAFIFAMSSWLFVLDFFR